MGRFFGDDQRGKGKNAEGCRRKGSKGCGELKFFGILPLRQAQGQDDSKGFAIWSLL
jgi:hypothetical protein